MTMPMDERQELAAEVIELGETLVDALIRAAASEEYLEAEVRAARDDFFRSLRLVLNLSTEEG